MEETFIRSSFVNNFFCTFLFIIIIIFRVLTQLCTHFLLLYFFFFYKIWFFQLLNLIFKNGYWNKIYFLIFTDEYFLIFVKLRTNFFINCLSFDLFQVSKLCNLICLCRKGVNRIVKTVVVSILYFRVFSKF